MTDTPQTTPAEPDSGFDAYAVEFVCETGVGLTIYPHKPWQVRKEPWMSWYETVAFSKWLAAKVEAENDKPTN